jgi:hypothetical protein
LVCIDPGSPTLGLEPSNNPEAYVGVVSVAFSDSIRVPLVGIGTNDPCDLWSSLRFPCHVMGNSIPVTSVVEENGIVCLSSGSVYGDLSGDGRVDYRLPLIVPC